MANLSILVSGIQQVCFLSSVAEALTLMMVAKVPMYVEVQSSQKRLEVCFSIHVGLCDISLYICMCVHDSTLLWDFKGGIEIFSVVTRFLRSLA